MLRKTCVDSTRLNLAEGRGTAIEERHLRVARFRPKESIAPLDFDALVTKFDRLRPALLSAR